MRINEDRVLKELVRQALPEHVTIIQDFLGSCGLDLKEATRRLRENEGFTP